MNLFIVQRKETYIKPCVIVVFITMLLATYNGGVIHLGFLGFRGEMKDHKINNVVTQNTSGKEEKAVAIIAEVGSH